MTTAHGYCKVLRGGAKLALLRVHMRLAKYCNNPTWKKHCSPSWGLSGPPRPGLADRVAPSTTLPYSGCRWLGRA